VEPRKEEEESMYLILRFSNNAVSLLSVFENRVLDLSGKQWREAGEDCKMRSFITCTLHQILSG
jgi:hypothetical protein